MVSLTAIALQATEDSVSDIRVTRYTACAYSHAFAEKKYMLITIIVASCVLILCEHSKISSRRLVIPLTLFLQ